ncbi:hypothetical protein L6452_38941 [Arctium lappa]|uniref:Uncharacterized protein n=1 Tax=Arctium lappa TaxID=4217 RepID=A0ACB8XRP1_ARCLA|nr:hypothetical protein L6452_38941 [Arctium lappa]
MEEYEKRFIKTKTRPRVEVLSESPIIEINDISEKRFAYNKIIYRHFVVIRAGRQVYEFTDNDLVNLNPFDLPQLHAYCSTKYEHERRYRMGQYDVQRAMSSHVKLRARIDFQISLNLGEERLEVVEPVDTVENLDKYKTGSIIVEPLGFVYRANLIKKIFLTSEVSKYSDETLRGVLRMIHVK